MKWGSDTPEDHPACQQRIACADCRSSRPFRESLFKKGWVEKVNFPCPYMLGGWGLGGLIEWIVKPLAKSLKLKCLDSQGKLRPKSKCAERRERMNRIGATQATKSSGK